MQSNSSNEMRPAVIAGRVVGDPLPREPGRDFEIGDERRACILADLDGVAPYGRHGRG